MGKITVSINYNLKKKETTIDIKGNGLNKTQSRQIFLMYLHKILTEFSNMEIEEKKVINK